MSLPNRNNPYDFSSFVDRRDGFDYYGDDPFLQALLKRYAAQDFPAIDARVKALSARASTQWRLWADVAALPENRPRLESFDGHGHRIDRIVRPHEVERLEAEVFGAGLFRAETPYWERLAKLLVINQNGEHGVVCAMTCTEGLIALLAEFRDAAAPEVDRILQHCKEGLAGDFGKGSQFLTEIQGGSDVQANVVEAVPDGSAFRLYGTKFFCSACHTDYAIVTAKVTGSTDVSTFVMPAWLTPDDKLRERRNGYAIRRLKRKLGTIELPTAEIDFDGAVVWLVGPQGRGIANVVGHVLTTSRINVSIANAATNLRAAREARMYGEFRTVFGQRLLDYPIGRARIDAMTRTAERTLAGLFRIYELLVELGGRQTAGLPKDDDIALRRKKMQLRLLIMMQKLTTTRDTIDLVHAAISAFGGHGVMECFGSLPRLLRDALINEQWEGPRDLLLSQLHSDLQRARAWYPAQDLARDLVPGPAFQPDVAKILQELTELDLFGQSSQAKPADALAWESAIDAIFHAYQDAALDDFQNGRKPVG